jgi:hypothetical protein
LLLLLVREDLLQPGVNFGLELVELFLLLGGEAEPLAHEGREDLSGAGRGTAEPARLAGAAAGAERAAGRASAAGPRARAELASSAAGRGRLAGEHRAEFFGRHGAVLVGVGAGEEAVQPVVRHLGSGQFAVAVLVERHHPGDGVTGRASVGRGPGGWWLAVGRGGAGLGLLLGESERRRREQEPAGHHDAAMRSHGRVLRKMEEGPRRPVAGRRG